MVVVVVGVGAVRTGMKLSGPQSSIDRFANLSNDR